MAKKHLTDAHSILNGSDGKDFHISEYEEMVLNVWDEFMQGVDVQTIGFPIWADEFGATYDYSNLPHWKQGFIAKNRELYLRNKIFLKSWLRRHEIVIGGAAFNAEAETFFRKIKFPCTVGYGMTECGPLISYSSSKIIKPFSTGLPVDTLQVKIDSEDPCSIVGEVLVKGENVMMGYYKNEEATQAIIDANGWFHTGDLGVLDKEGNIYLKGRSKNMILGASGQNIYPEEIESVLDNKFGIMASMRCPYI